MHEYFRKYVHKIIITENVHQSTQASLLSVIRVRAVLLDMFLIVTLGGGREGGMLKPEDNREHHEGQEPKHEEDLSSCS